MIYILITAWLLILAYIYDIRGFKKNKSFWFVFIQLVLILLAGLRYRIGTDTPNYIERFYREYPALDAFSFSDYPIGGDGPLYVLMNSFIISLGGRFFLVQLIQAAFVISLVFRYVKKHSNYIFTCAFFYFIVCFVQFNYEIMRGSMSIVVCLYANDMALEKKWIKSYTLYFIAILFHFQAVVLLLLPLFRFVKFNPRAVLILLVAFVGGFLVQLYFGELINALALAEAVNNKATRYAENEVFNGAGGNFYYYVVYIFPLLFYTIYSLFIIKRSHQSTNNIIELEPWVMLGLMFLLLQMNLQIMSRFVDYFRAYFVLYIAECTVLVCQKKNSSRFNQFVKLAVFLIPFLFLTGYQYKNTYRRYYPYSSVLNRTIDSQRENEIYNPMVGVADINEY